jgi:hypothetical protein
MKLKYCRPSPRLVLDRSIVSGLDVRQAAWATSRKHFKDALQSRLLPAIPSDRHEITLLVREANFLLFPESDLLAVALQSINHLSQQSRLWYNHFEEPSLPPLGATYFPLSTLGSITTFSVLKSAVQQ